MKKRRLEHHRTLAMVKNICNAGDIFTHELYVQTWFSYAAYQDTLFSRLKAVRKKETTKQNNKTNKIKKPRLFTRKRHTFSKIQLQCLPSKMFFKYLWLLKKLWVVFIQGIVLGTSTVGTSVTALEQTGSTQYN